MSSASKHLRIYAANNFSSRYAVSKCESRLTARIILKYIESGTACEEQKIVGSIYSQVL